MRYPIFGAALMLVLASSSTGRTVRQSGTSAAQVTMCDLYRNPEQYAGKMVQFRASVVRWDAKHFWLDDFAPSPGCKAYMRVVTAFPNDVSPKASFQFVQDDSWRRVVEQVKSSNVEAAFVGQFEPHFVWREHKRVKVADGAASKKQDDYDGRLVLLSVSDVIARPRSHK
jgi:hypothetical protein